MSNPGGSRRNGAMKIRLTSECEAFFVHGGVERLATERESRRDMGLSVSTHESTHLPTHGLFLLCII